MAKAVGGGYSAETRGKVGGIVYGVWRGFQTIRAKHAPSQPRSFKQLAIRAFAIHLSRAWQLNAHQADWDTYAQSHTLVDWTNTPKRLTGHNWFVGLNTRLVKLGNAIVATPPYVPAPDAVVGLAAVGTAGSIALTWTPPIVSANKIEVWLDGPHSPGRIPSIVRAKYHDTVVGTPGTETITVTTGTWSVYARALDLTNGLVSVWVGVNVVVPPPTS